MEAVSLGEILGKKVNVTPVTVLDDDPADNFVMDDPEPVEVIEPEEVSDRAEPEHGYMPPDHIGETIVNTLDGLQSSVLPFLLEMKVFTKKEKELLQTIDTTGSTPYPLNSQENNLLEKWKRHQEKVKQVPFNDGEKTRLIAATARYAETTEMKLSPLEGLMLSFSEVVFKRGAMFFTE
ncbi:hypothetical protein ACFSR6_03370 [Pedobacter vanadiisoli]|uniref:Uncharacterized protein n=1 Tax=Pedobacter vanadiisoli TaxID=1761975 RepID=A0ABW5MIE9_9SPHI